MTTSTESLSRRARAVAAFVRHCPDIDAAERQVADALMEERERCALLQPSTAGNPNDSDYERGRFDGIMEFAAAIRRGDKP